MTTEQIKKSDISSFSLSTFQSLLSGCIAGMIAKTSTAPLDRVKIIFQTSDVHVFTWKNLFNRISNDYKTFGVSELFRGNAAMLLRIGPYAAIQFTVFEKCKKNYLEYTGRTQLNPGLRFTFGSIAGITSVIFTYPIDMLRARLIVEGKGVVRRIFSENPKLFFAGMTPTILGMFFYGGFSFGTFETLKRSYLNGKIPLITPQSYLPNSYRLIFGALAGLISITATYPFDTVRRRFQVDGAKKRYFSIFDAFKKIYITEGFSKGLCKGLTINWIKGPLATAISFTVFDVLKTYFKTNRNN